MLCFEILSVCTPRKDGVLETPSFRRLLKLLFDLINEFLK